MGDERMNSIEISQIDLRYEDFRLKDRHRERILLSSIQEKGVLEPVYGVGHSPVILLDGFKRYRCAKALGIGLIGCTEIAPEPSTGILQLIRTSNAKSLNLLEQARWLDELHEKYGLSVAAIAERVERSKTWVSMRLGILKAMRPTVRDAVFSGQFPVRSYLYTLQQLTRVSAVSGKEVEEFVEVTRNKNLSTRDIDSLARGFFYGSQELKDQIRKGDLGWSLSEMKKVNQRESQSQSLNETESRLIRDLEIIQKYVRRVSRSVNDPRLTSKVFAEANLLAGGVLKLLPSFSHVLEKFYDHSRKA